MYFVHNIRNHIIKDSAQYYLSAFRARIKNETSLWFAKRYPACLKHPTFNDLIADNLTTALAEHIVKHPESFYKKFSTPSNRRASYPFIDTLLSLKAIEADPDKYKLTLLSDNSFIDNKSISRPGNNIRLSVVHDINNIRQSLKDVAQYSEGDVALAMLETYNPIDFNFHSDWLIHLRNRDHKKALHKETYREVFLKVLSPKGLHLAYKTQAINWEDYQSERLTQAQWRHLVQNIAKDAFVAMGYHTAEEAICNYAEMGKNLSRPFLSDDIFSEKVNCKFRNAIAQVLSKIDTNTHIAKLKKSVMINKKFLLTGFIEGINNQRQDKIKKTGFYKHHATYAAPLIKRIKRMTPAPFHQIMHQMCYWEWEQCNFTEGKISNSLVLQFAGHIKSLSLDFSETNRFLEQICDAVKHNIDSMNGDDTHLVDILSLTNEFAEKLRKTTQSLIVQKKALTFFLNHIHAMIKNNSLSENEIISLIEALSLCEAKKSPEDMAILFDDVVALNSTIKVSWMKRFGSTSINYAREIIRLKDSLSYPDEYFTYAVDSICKMHQQDSGGNFLRTNKIEELYDCLIKNNMISSLKQVIDSGLVLEGLFIDNEMDETNNVLVDLIEHVRQMPEEDRHYCAKIMTGLYSPASNIPDDIIKLLPHGLEQLAPTLTYSEAPYAKRFIDEYITRNNITPMDYLSECPEWQHPAVMKIISQSF